MDQDERTGGPGWAAVAVLVSSGALVSVLGEVIPRLLLESPFGGFGYRREALVASGLVVLAALTLVWCITNRLALALVSVTGLVALVAASHVRKMQILARPLMPWDLLQAKQVIALLPTVLSDPGSVLTLAGLALCVVLVVVVSLRRPRWPLAWRWRATGAIVASLWLGLLVFQNRHPMLREGLRQCGVVNYIWDQQENLRHNGLALAMVMNLGTLFVALPGYDETQVRAVMDAPPPPASQGPDEPADVVVYMAESVFDPTTLGVPLSADPMPTLRRLMREQTSGTLWSPSYGGGTANVEFEVLTGLTTAFLPEGAMPYQHYVNAALEALPAVFRSAGYRTLAIHNFHGWYWMRTQVYPLLGFDRFVPLEELEDRRDGPYPSDEVLVDRVIAELADESKPSFLFAISMVTHGPYGYEPAERPEVSVVSGLGDEAARELTNYASAVRKADRALERLVDALSKRQRRTVLVVFGDHLPALGARHAVYKEAGFVQHEMGPADYEKVARVPLLVWSNRPAPRRELELGMTFLGPEILSAAGLAPHGWFATVRGLGTKVGALSHEFVRTPDARVLPFAQFADAGPDTKAAVEALRLVSYDRLLGKRYSLAGNDPAP